MTKLTPQKYTSVTDYFASLDEQTARDSKILIDMMQRISGHAPKMWNVGTIGFDTYHYEYTSGRKGDNFIIGFYPRKGKITIYLMDGIIRPAELLAKLGKHTTSGYCIYIKQLSDIKVILACPESDSGVLLSVVPRMTIKSSTSLSLSPLTFGRLRNRSSEV